MTEYAKLENNQLEYAPTDHNGISNWINDEKAVLAAGYLPVEFHNRPDDGKVYTESFEQLSDKIVQRWVEKVFTREEIEQQRKWGYTEEVDPITAHIQRLRDEPQTDEVQAEITALIAERTAKVAEIKTQYPYPED